MNSYNRKKVELKTHKQQLRRNLMKDYNKVSKKSRKPWIIQHWQGAAIGAVVVMLLVVGTLQIPFGNKQKQQQKVSAKEVVQKAKNNYFQKVKQKNQKTHYPEYYEAFEIWDYFPEDDPVVIEDFDEYGFFEVLDNYEDELFEADFIEKEDEMPFYEVQFIENGRKIQLLIEPEDFEIIQIDIFDELDNNPGQFSPRYSQQWT